jgi:phenylpropionate dioxygenase-like ring-hydroxylating dioxygenase large terminal subunit
MSKPLPQVMQNPNAPAAPLSRFEREADWSACGALRDFWYVGCTSADLAHKQPVSATILGVRLALFRDAQGRAAAVRDKCMHRGTPLSAGVVIDGHIACPYHGWMYEAGGACTHIPSLGPQQHSTTSFDDQVRRPADVTKLQTFATREQDGLVYVFVGTGEPRKDPFPVPHYGDKNWNVYYMVNHFENGVTSLVENFMDVPHTVFVHAGWFRSAKRQKVPAEVERTADAVLVTYDQGKDKLDGMGILLNPTGKHPMVHTDRYYTPNITRVDYTYGDNSGFVITSQCTPISAVESRVYTAISHRFPFDVSGMLGKLIEPVLHWYTQKVIEQDVDIMRVQKAGILDRKVTSTAMSPHSSEADLHQDIEALRGWLLAGATSPPPAPAKRSIEFWI